MTFVHLTLSFLPDMFWASGIVLQLAAGALLLALVVGMFVALVRISGNRFLTPLAVIYLELFRGTPLLVQLIYIYFGLPALGFSLSPVMAGILGLGLNYGAYLSEVFRSSIESIDAGQNEAALSLGYTPRKSLFRIVIPQSLLVALPSVGNYFVSMLKDTALTSVIAVVEIVKTANVLASTTFQTVPIYTAAALMYLILSLPLSRLLVIGERKLRTYA
jgi:His/Glu/Gln/Arg/opine family amino acid ABC transporter permease subunit